MFKFKKLLVVAIYIISFSYSLNLVYERTINNLKLLDYFKVCICVLLAVMFHYFMIYKDMNKRNIQVIKEIFLTSKKGIGLYGIVLFLVGGMMGFFFSSVNVSKAYAYPKIQNMWVELRDVSERKMLIQNDSLYEITDKVRIEIPKEAIPKNKIHLQVIATTDDGEIYESREFLMVNK